jgi:hypothetical protein
VDVREDEHTAIGESPVFETAPPAAVQSISPSYEDDEDEEVATVPPPRASLEAAHQAQASAEPAQHPMASVAPPALNGHANGVLFAYHEGLPLPERPPRPELDASLRVSPAPRPTPDAH